MHSHSIHQINTMSSNTNYKTAVVTGASSGIGRSIAIALSGAGFEVHGLARREEALELLEKETNCTTHQVDVNDTEALEHVLRGIDVDILVNNAGLGRGYDGLVNASSEDVARVVQTNVMGTINATRIALDGMIARKRGHVVNIGSTTGIHATGLALYGASKGAIRLLGQNLRIELKGSGIRVTEVCPGRVLTPFFETAFDAPESAGTLTDGLTCLSPQDVANAVMYAVTSPWHCNISTIELQPTEQTIGGMSVDPVS